MDKPRKSVFTNIVSGDYCIGCGACAVVSEKIEMRMSQQGLYQPHNDVELDGIEASETLSVCPFSEEVPNETQLAAELFSDTCVEHNQIGYYHSTYAGHVLENDYRAQGSSGGFGSWLCCELLRLKKVDAIVHVLPATEGEPFFQYGISRTPEQVTKGSKSRYYPIELSKVVEQIRHESLTVAVVGIPCFLKALRLLMNNDSQLKEKIRYCIGLVCGHLKTTGFAESLAWQLGVQPSELAMVDFRHKLPNQAANKYGFRATRKDGTCKTAAMENLLGYNWGMGFFKPNACEYCDDVLAETADVVIGDAWLPRYVKDSQGTNIVLVRNPVFETILGDAINKKRIVLDNLTADEVARSQSSGLRHRREGLAYRLWLKDQARQWRPTKRVQSAADHIGSNRKSIYEARMELASESHKQFLRAKTENNIKLFIKGMLPLIFKYKKLMLKEQKCSLLRHWKGLLHMRIALFLRKLR